MSYLKIGEHSTKGYDKVERVLELLDITIKSNKPNKKVKFDD